MWICSFNGQSGLEKEKKLSVYFRSIHAMNPMRLVVKFHQRVIKKMRGIARHFILMPCNILVGVIKSNHVVISAYYCTDGWRTLSKDELSRAHNFFFEMVVNV